MCPGATSLLVWVLLTQAPQDANQPARDPNVVVPIQNPNAPLTAEDQEILENLELFRLFQLLRDLGLFSEGA